MASWAEVVEPSTRALIDDDSDEEALESQSAESLTQAELIWKEEENTADISVFIIAHGTLSSLFVKKFILEEHHAVIAEVLESKGKEALEKASGSSQSLTTSPVYRINKNVYICLCNDSNINNANKFRNAILPLLQKSAQVVVISTQKASSYIYDKLANDVCAPFIRYLHSGSFKSHCETTYLEQPNIITGIPAAILGWCEIHHVPGVLYCCYSDTNELNSISAEPYVKVFSSLSSDIFDPSKVTFKKQSYGPVTTNLYM